MTNVKYKAHIAKITLYSERKQDKLLMDMLVSDEGTKIYTHCFMRIRCLEHEKCLNFKIKVDPLNFFRYKRALATVKYVKIRTVYGQKIKGLEDIDIALDEHLEIEFEKKVRR